jgi:hypothetical protein
MTMMADDDAKPVAVVVSGGCPASYYAYKAVKQKERQAARRTEAQSEAQLS